MGQDVLILMRRSLVWQLAIYPNLPTCLRYSVLPQRHDPFQKVRRNYTA